MRIAERASLLKNAMLSDHLQRLPRGSYWIGDDTSSNAAPRHRRTFGEDVWIASRLAAWSDFELFVTSGGYSNAFLWRTETGVAFPGTCLPHSVDDRCEQVRAATIAGQQRSRVRLRPANDWPVLGLTWFESIALCRSLGARLPYESEWEAAMAARLIASTDSESVYQEWTADAYVNRYWRVDERVRGNEWDADEEVVVRGHGRAEPSMAVTARRAVAPNSKAAERGFRFVWPKDPAHEAACNAAGHSSSPSARR